MDSAEREAVMIQGLDSFQPDQQSHIQQLIHHVYVLGLRYTASSHPTVTWDNLKHTVEDALAEVGDKLDLVSSSTPPSLP